MVIPVLRKVAPAVLALVFGCCVAASPAHGNQTNLQILLGTSSFELDFTGMGNHIAVNDRTCSGSTCTFASGSASGSAGPFSTSGTYLITSPSKTAFTLTPNASGGFSVSQAAPLSFVYTSPQGNLTGTLEFVSVAMVPGSTNSATLVGTFTLTGGSLASAFGVATAPVTASLSVANSLGTLIGTMNVLTGQVEFPSRITPLPEPASLLLVCSGLAALAGIRRKRNRATRPASLAV